MNHQPEHREVVVITGATAGVGRATTREFARRGASIGLLARGEDGLAATQAEVEELGGRALAIPTDVSDAQAVDEAAQRVEEELGPIDTWVNNAMTTIFSPITEIEPFEFRRATDVTYLGTVYGTMSALKRMIPRDRGTIVQVGSALAYRAIPLQAPYCGAKHAIRGFTDSLRSELIHDRRNIHVTMVQLPGLNTPQFSWCESRLPNKPQPVPPIFQPEVAGRAIYWAAHHRRREVYVGRSTVMTVYGQKFLPWFLDRYLASAAWGGQQTDQPASPRRQSNLFEPVGGDHGAHGDFDPRAESRSWQFQATSNRRLLASGAAAIGGLALGLLSRRLIG